jgi:hypothetical protein
MTGKALRKLVGKVRDLRARHAERRTPTSFGFVIADGVELLDTARWDALTADASLYFSRRYLRALGAAGPSNIRLRAALVFRGDVPVAAIVAQAVGVSLAKLASPGTKRAKATKLAPLEEHVLVCGNLLSWGQHGVHFARGEQPALLWPAVAEALYRMRRADKLCGDSALILIKDFPSTLELGQAALERFSYRALETEPNMVLELKPAWKSYDDYLASLSSDYRRSAKKIAREVEEAGAELVLVGDVERHAERLNELYLEVHEQQKLRLFTLHPRFLPTLAAELGADMRIRAIMRKGRILGFITTLKDGDTAIGSYVGFERAALAEMPLYLRLLHAGVRDAIELGCKRLSLGRTALEPKARLGAKPERLSIYVRHRVPAFNLLMRGLLAGVDHDEAPERNPFK